MADDPFALLRGGLKFKRGQRLSADTSAALEEPAGIKAEASAASALDFFQMTAAPTKASSGSKKKSKAKESKAKAKQGGGPDTPRIKRQKQSELLARASSPEDVSDGEDMAANEEDDDSVDDSAFRRRHRIYVKGTDVAPPLRSMAGLKSLLSSKALAGRAAELYSQPTPIQRQAIPALLQGRDVLGVAPTGSGKTLAFALPVLQALGRPKNDGVRAVIVAPTRELAQQISREAKQLNTALNLRMLVLTKANASKHGGEPFKKFDIVITTPMRLVHALKTEKLVLDTVEWLVFDEADRLFENGFEHQVDEIIHACSNPRRHLALFSATMPQRVEELAQSVLKDYIRINVGVPHAAATTVDQKLVFVGREDGKVVAIRQLIQEGITPPVLVFVQSKSRAQDLFHELIYDGINVDVIHADRTQQQRDTVVKHFREGKVWVLICTDLMARGIDFKGVNMVINYDFPPSAVEYIHRVGRTGRAGRKGRAVTFFTQADGPLLRSIATVVKSSGCDVPEWMLQLKKLKKHKRGRTIERAPIASDPKKQEAFMGRKRKSSA